MIERQAFTWNVTLASERSGGQIETPFTSFWDPEKVSGFEVANAAAATLTAESKSKHLPISAVLA